MSGLELILYIRILLRYTIRRLSSVLHESGVLIMIKKLRYEIDKQS